MGGILESEWEKEGLSKRACACSEILPASTTGLDYPAFPMLLIVYSLHQEAVSVAALFVAVIWPGLLRRAFLDDYCGHYGENQKKASGWLSLLSIKLVIEYLLEARFPSLFLW